MLQLVTLFGIDNVYRNRSVVRGEKKLEKKSGAEMFSIMYVLFCSESVRTRCYRTKK